VTDLDQSTTFAVRRNNKTDNVTRRHRRRLNTAMDYQTTGLYWTIS